MLFPREAETNTQAIKNAARTWRRDFKDIDGQYYRVPITAGMNGNEETVYSIGEIRNAITSMYGKNHSISKVLKNAINDENNGKFRMYYLDVTKATALLQVAKVPMPKMPATHDGGFINSLSDPRSPVKLKYGSVTETQQFKSWFGDRKNHPENASKVVNADGTPKVVYHGTNNDFTVFQSKSGMYWFSETEDYAEEMAYFKDIDGQYYRVPITVGRTGMKKQYIALVK